LEIARALVTQPRFLLLDEPFAGIDPITVLDLQRLIRHLKKEGYGILITDHNVRDTLKITDRASIIKDGKVLASGDPEQLAGDPVVRQVYLGEEFEL
jgi:lipopolysaccharide export system ATP-binding protein